MPFLGAETALGCVGGRQVAILPRPWRRQPKQADFWGKRFRAILERFTGPDLQGHALSALALYRPEAAKTGLAVAATITGGFSSKRY
jgi:hypothetical protein